MPQPHQSQITLSDTTVLWRYMDVSQFLWVLANRQLHFSSWKKFHDRYEGRFPGHWVENSLRLKFPYYVNEDLTHRGSLLRTYRKSINMRLEQFRVSCWHENDDESVAMWNLYPRGVDGVAIQTTVGNLKAALAKNFMEEHTHIGRVSYDRFPRKGEYDPSLHSVQVLPLMIKKPWYRHEQEVRMVRWAGVESEMPFGRRDPKKGENATVDLTRLIKRIVVSPDYPAHLLPGLQWAIKGTKLQLPGVKKSSCQPPG